MALLLGGRLLGALVPQLTAYVQSLGGWAPLVFVAVYAGATVAFVPGSLLTLAAGAMFGLFRGMLGPLPPRGACNERR